MPELTVVRCCLCGLSWLPSQPGILYRSADRRWWCRNELACRQREARRAEELAAMQRGLDRVWAEVERAFGAMPPARPGK